MSQTDPLDGYTGQLVCKVVFENGKPTLIAVLDATKDTVIDLNAEIAKAVRKDRERIRLLLVEYGVVSSQIFNPATEELRSLWHEIAQLEQPHEI